MNPLYSKLVKEFERFFVHLRIRLKLASLLVVAEVITWLFIQTFSDENLFDASFSLGRDSRVSCSPEKLTHIFSVSVFRGLRPVLDEQIISVSLNYSRLFFELVWVFDLPFPVLMSMSRLSLTDS